MVRCGAGAEGLQKKRGEDSSDRRVKLCNPGYKFT